MGTAALAARHRMPLSSELRRYVETGALMSYGPSDIERILKGKKPGDLPVMQPRKIRVPDQSQDRQGARPDRAVQFACRRR
jgi:hypothetical protein